MSRKKRKSSKRSEITELIHNDSRLAKFINKVMLDGKKTIAEKIVYTSLTNLSNKVEAPEIEAFEKALNNIMPKMEVKSRRVGGSTYQVPIEVRFERSMALAMRWIINFARSRKGRNMVDSLSQELIDAYNNVGAAVKKREETHKMAESNKAFAHFRW